MNFTNPFQKILSLGSSFLKGSAGNGSVLGIDIGTSAIKIAQIRKEDGRAVLETYGSIALGPYANLDAGATTNLNPADLKAPIDAVLKESGVTTTNAMIAIPSPASMVFVVELPPGITDKQIPEVIPTEARRFIPVPIGEVKMDYWQIPKKEESFEDPTVEHPEDPHAKTEVLVAAIHNDTVARYKDIGTATGLSLDVEIETFSTIRSVFNRELSPTMVVDLGALKTKVAILEYGVVKSVHLINRGGKDISEGLVTSLNISFAKAEELKKQLGVISNPTNPQVAEVVRLSTDFIVGELQSVLLSYEHTHGKTINKIILSGGGALLPGFIEIIREKTGREVVLGNPFSKVGVPPFLEKILEQTGPEFSVAVGLALGKLGE